MTIPIIIGRIDESALVPVSAEEGGWEPTEGDASARSRVFVQNAGMRSGILTYGPCTASERVKNYSSIQILEGELTIIGDDGVIDLGPGDIAHFVPGQEVTITAKTPVREIFTTCGPFEE